MNPCSLDILYVITDLEFGGVPLHLYRLACAMRDRGYRSSVVCLAPAGPVAGLLREEGIDVRSCEGRGGFDYGVIGRLACIIKDTQPTMLHAMLFHANVASRWAARRVGFPKERVICEIQTVEVERPWHLWVDRWTFGYSRLMIGNSPSVIEHLATQARIPRDHLHLIRGGIDPVRVQAAKLFEREALKIPPDRPIILWVGRLDPVKGLDTLVDAFELVGSKTKAHLILAGDGPLRNRLDTQVQRSAWSQRIHLLGTRDDIPSLLRAASVFAFPSRTEGLPNALLEAMAAGCPIVTTDVPGCRDLIEHEASGLLVPYGDTHALANAMEFLLRHRDVAMRFGRRAVEVVTKSWHIEQTHAGYAHLYQAIRAEGEPPPPSTI